MSKNLNKVLNHKYLIVPYALYSYNIKFMYSISKIYSTVTHTNNKKIIHLCKVPVKQTYFSVLFKILSTMYNYT